MVYAVFRRTYLEFPSSFGVSLAGRGEAADDLGAEPPPGGSSGPGAAG